MPLVEFMMHASTDGNPNGRVIPGFIRGSADFHNPTDNTYVGWVADNRDFYLPDTITILDKASFVQRMLAIHQVTPIKGGLVEQQVEQDGRVGVQLVPGPILTEEQVIAMAEERYDFIVNHCKAEEGSL